MRMSRWGLCAAGALLFSAAVQADDEPVVAGVRAGPTLGTYKLKNSVRVTSGEGGGELGVPGTFSTSDSSFAYGGQLAPWVKYGKFFGEVSLDLLRYKIDGEDTDRTDIIPAVGYTVGNQGTVFVGYRRGMQSDSFFSDKSFSEKGFVFGAGLGNLPMDSVVFNLSAAYNLSKVDGFGIGGKNFDYNGFSIKVGAALAEHPEHRLQLRYQRFSGNDSANIDVNGDEAVDRVKSKLEEDYLQLIYLYNFAL